jgi:hypothetical protein
MVVTVMATEENQPSSDVPPAKTPKQLWQANYQAGLRVASTHYSGDVRFLMDFFQRQKSLNITPEDKIKFAAIAERWAKVPRVRPKGGSK